MRCLHCWERVRYSVLDETLGGSSLFHPTQWAVAMPFQGVVPEQGSLPG